MSEPETRSVVRTAAVMGTMASAHVHLATNASAELLARIDRSIDAAFADLRTIDALCSTYRDDSDVSRIADGRLALDDAHPLVRELAARSKEAEVATRGLVSAHWRGAFDPTGIAKGWAVERALDAHLRPLLDLPGVLAVGLGAGGDMQLASEPDSGFAWRVGVTDPARPGSLLAVLEVADGGVATSGTAERGAHIVDPRTGAAAVGAVSATVVADSLTDADIWATAAVVAGAGDLSWVPRAGTRMGLIVGHEGSVRRWSGPAEVVAARPLDG